MKRRRNSGSVKEDLRWLTDEAMERGEEICRRAILTLFGAVVRDTPVDTGLLRGNWQATTQEPASGTRHEGEDPPIPPPDIETPLADLRLGQDAWLVNNLDYADDIEYGRSKKAPDGMLRRNVVRWQSIVRSAARSVR